MKFIRIDCWEQYEISYWALEEPTERERGGGGGEEGREVEEGDREMHKSFIDHVPH